LAPISFIMGKISTLFWISIFKHQYTEANNKEWVWIQAGRLSIRATCCRLILCLPQLYWKSAILYVSQMYHLKSKNIPLHQCCLHLSVIWKVKICNVCSYYIYTHDRIFLILFGKLNTCQVGLGCSVNESTSGWELFLLTDFINWLGSFQFCGKNIYHHKPVT
jgi:hypothetical protein